VARIASGIANDGIMMPSRYVLDVNGHPTQPKQGVAIAGDPVYAQYLETYMREQSAPKKSQFGIYVAGKTGTPERIVKGETINDGWYVFFAPAANDSGHVVVCIRIEGTKGSSDAMALAGAHIIPLLLQSNYIKSFEPVKKPLPQLDKTNDLTMRPPQHDIH
jgi:cell division protein FtsI/penicillin-binding protein 2